MISVRPAMHARDSSGRQVSLLNDEPGPPRDRSYATLPTRYDDGREFSRSNSYVSDSSPPRTPGLWRSDSYDSRTSNDAHSPLTPSLAEYGRQGSYGASYPDPSPYEKCLARSPVYASYAPKSQASESTRQATYAKGAPSAYQEAQVEGSAAEPKESSTIKRYPCRFKQLHGCDKSFTTSGHASRHSKIHTAEKAVHCLFQDCPKKFTRADNMKQHLETHYKDRARAAANLRRNSLGAPKLTLAAGIKKPSVGARTTSRPSSRAGWTEQLTIDTRDAYAPYSPDLYADVSSYSAASPTTSPRSSYGALDMGAFQRALPTPALSSSRPAASRGLEALAAAVASQTRQ